MTVEQGEYKTPREELLEKIEKIPILKNLDPMEQIRQIEEAIDLLKRQKE